jgi:hypothetical protein
MNEQRLRLSPVYHFNLIIRGFHAVSYRPSCISLFYFSSPSSRVALDSAIISERKFATITLSVPPSRLHHLNIFLTSAELMPLRVEKAREMPATCVSKPCDSVPQEN